MDNTDLDRTRIVPIATGENVLVTENISKDRHGRWDGHPPREENAKPDHESLANSSEEKSTKKDPTQGRIIDIVI